MPKTENFILCGIEIPCFSVRNTVAEEAQQQLIDRISELENQVRQLQILGPQPGE